MRIMKTELRVLFFSPIAWMVLIVFAFQAGLAYCGGFSDELRSWQWDINHLTQLLI